MIYKNAELYNVSELLPLEDGGVTWRRVPAWVEEEMQPGGVGMNRAATGVEIRFVLEGEEAVLRMAALPESYGDGTAMFHVFRGGIQGGWEDHEVDKYVGTGVHDFVIRRSPNPDFLRRAAAQADDPFDPAVIRIVFDRGHYRLLDILGKVRPPRREECPARTLLFYGSSITHGSNAIDQSHSFASVIGHRLHTDVRNLGFAGHCRMEPAMAEYLAAEGERGAYDAAVLELGINVLDWEESRIRERVGHLLRQVAGRNPEKPVLVLSPFYCNEDFRGGTRAARWRAIIAESVADACLPNLTYINGLDLLGSAALLSADEVHPNLYGVATIADRLGEQIRRRIDG